MQYLSSSLVWIQWYDYLYCHLTVLSRPSKSEDFFSLSLYVQTEEIMLPGVTTKYSIKFSSISLVWQQMPKRKPKMHLELWQEDS